MLASIFSLNVIQTALELGCIYALVALALFLSYSILNIADLSTDGCFTLGCAVACQVALTGHPFLALLAAMAAGVCSGFVTAFLQTRLGVESIMAGIIVNTGLYTINLAVMGFSSTMSLVKTDTVFSIAKSALSFTGGGYKLVLAAAVIALAGAAMLAAQLLRLEPLLLPGGVFYPLRARAILFLAALCCGLCHLIFSRVTAHSGQLVPLTLRIGTRTGMRTVPLTALLDTGNTLKDPLTGEPVLVVDGSIAAQLLPDAGLSTASLADPAGLFASLSEQYPFCRFRLIPYRAVGTVSGLLLAIRCEVSGKSGKPELKLVAFSPTPVSQTGEFDALIGGCL